MSKNKFALPRLMHFISMLKENRYPTHPRLVEEMRKHLNFTSLQFHRLDDLVESIGLDPCKLCTYCWSGKK